MGCRCSDISRCQNELNILSGVVCADIQQANSGSAQISQALKLAAGSVVEALNTDTIYDVNTLLGALNQRGGELSQGLCSACNSEVRRLSSLLQQMRSEDRAHHEAEAAAAAAAAANSGK